MHAARKHKPYFQSHVICVLTDLPMRQVLYKSEASGRLMKWAIELGEHEIYYLPWKAIKGQTLADFLVELGEDHLPTRDPGAASQEGQDATTHPDFWQLWVDGASRQGHCGAGVLLVSPSGIEFSYAL